MTMTPLRSEIQSFCSLNETNLICLRNQSFAFSINMHLSEKKYLSANETSFMTKELPNAIMKRSKYKNKF